MNSKAREGEIIADWIFRTASGKGICNFFRSFPVRRISSGQSQFPRQPVHVRVQRDNQTAGGNGIPAARIHFVFPHQPTEHQVKTFTCAAAFRRRQKSRFSSRKKTAEFFRKTFRCGENRPIPGGKSRQKTLFQRTMTFKRSLHPPEELCKVFSSMKTVFESGKISFELFRRSGLKIPTGRISHDLKDAPDAFQNLIHPAVGKRRCQQSRDFPVFNSPERQNGLQRIRMDVPGVVADRIKPLQSMTERLVSTGNCMGGITVL